MTRRFPLKPAAPVNRPWNMTIRMPPKAAAAGGCCCRIEPLVWRETGDIVVSPWRDESTFHADIEAETCGPDAAFEVRFVSPDDRDAIEAAGSAAAAGMPDASIDGKTLTVRYGDDWGGWRGAELCVVLICGDHEFFSNPLYARSPA